ncbi:MAG: hypothetical protein WCV69_03640 [Patescibacteria group bacterium]|jgi:uncharacterized membrane protein
MEKIQINKHDVEEHKVSAAMSYVGILCLFPLMFKRHSPYAHFHAKQGLLLFLLEIVCAAFFPLLWPVFILAIYFAVRGISQTLHGKYWRLPILGRFVEKLNV